METDKLSTSDLPAVHSKLSVRVIPTDIGCDKETERRIDESGPEPIDNFSENKNAQSFVQKCDKETERRIDESGPGPTDKFSENKNARAIFLQKVLSIFLIQKMAMGLAILMFYLCRVWQWPYFYITIPILIAASIFYLVGLGLMVYYEEARKKSPYNYLTLVYHPLSTIFIFLVATNYDLYGGYIYQSRFFDIFLHSWKSYMLAVLANVFYVVLALDTKHEIRLRNNILITTAVFAVSYVCTPYLYGYWFFGRPFTILYVNIILYLYLLFVLYDVHAMTGSNYRPAMTPADYVNGAVNLQFDLIVIPIRFIKRNLVSCFGQTQ